jgi:S1-C subfamily serine protease
VKCLLLPLAGLLPLHVAGAEPDIAASLIMASSVLRIEVPREGSDGFGLGSGVSVKPDEVVTNCHVTREAREIRVIRDGRRWPVAAEAADIEHDLCLLRVPGLQARPATLGRSSDLKIGQSLTAHGYTFGLNMQHSTGEVIGLHRLDGASVIQSSNWFNSGASGGGLFDEAGQLVGILTFRLRGSERRYYASPAEWVQRMLDEPGAHPFRAVAPIESAQSPYWQQAGDAPPRFLNAR